LERYSLNPNYVSYLVGSNHHCYTSTAAFFTASTTGLARSREEQDDQRDAAQAELGNALVRTHSSETGNVSLADWVGSLSADNDGSADSQCNGVLLAREAWQGEDYCDAALAQKAVTLPRRYQIAGFDYSPAMIGFVAALCFMAAAASCWVALRPGGTDRSKAFMRLTLELPQACREGTLESARTEGSDSACWTAPEGSDTSIEEASQGEGLSSPCSSCESPPASRRSLQALCAPLWPSKSSSPRNSVTRRDTPGKASARGKGGCPANQRPLNALQELAEKEDKHRVPLKLSRSASHQLVQPSAELSSGVSPQVQAREVSHAVPFFAPPTASTGHLTAAVPPVQAVTPSASTKHFTGAVPPISPDRWASMAELQPCQVSSFSGAMTAPAGVSAPHPVTPPMVSTTASGSSSVPPPVSPRMASIVTSLQPCQVRSRGGAMTDRSPVRNSPGLRSDDGPMTAPAGVSRRQPLSGTLSVPPPVSPRMVELRTTMADT
jgi:hypothetical protein